jgi:uncharacterized protein (TIGR03083 family)
MAETDPAAVRAALVRQWKLIAGGLSALILDTPSRVSGWRNREVVAHIAMQPSLFARFLKSASQSPPQVSLISNLSGTASLADVIDSSARTATGDDLDFDRCLRRSLPAIEGADLAETITTMQGPVTVSDYLRTRCVEAVVHGSDLVPAIIPDDEALAIAASALIEVLAASRPDLVPLAKALPPLVWLDQATGRQHPDEGFAGILPLMT